VDDLAGRLMVDQISVRRREKLVLKVEPDILRFFNCETQFCRR